MKALTALMAVAAIGIGMAACGGADTDARSTLPASSRAEAPGPAARTTAGTTSATVVTAAALNTTPTLREFKSDEDDDDTTSGETGNTKDEYDADFDDDHKNESNGYYDGDDTVVSSFGRVASVADTQAITALVRRYYKVAAADDGAAACSMMYSRLNESITEDYGQGAGPPNLRGKNCQTVMTKLFAHPVNRLSTHFEMIAVRVTGNQAYALFGSRMMPASDISLKRERGAWKINNLIGGPLQ